MRQDTFIILVGIIIVLFLLAWVADRYAPEQSQSQNFEQTLPADENGSPSGEGFGDFEADFDLSAF